LSRPGKGDSEVVLGVDVGTSSLKAGLFSLDGTPLGLTQAEYPLATPEEGAEEQDPEDWWAALGFVARELMALLEDPSRLAAVSIGGQAPTLVAADAEFMPTHPAITWLDQRPADEADLLYAQLGQPVPVWGSWPAQAAWFVRNRPAVLRQTRWLFGCPDYLASRLTHTASTMLSTPLAELEAAGLDTRLLPLAAIPGTVIGHVDRAAAEETHLPAGTPIVGGFVDGVLGVLGSGVRSPGDACMNCGTSGTFSVVSLPPLGYPMMGLSILGSATNTSGKALDWFAHQIAPGGAGYAELIAEAATTPPGADGLLFLPHLAGERAPERDPHSRAAWVGLTLGHDRRHLLRALLEGVAFSFRSIQDWVESCGAEVIDVRCVGGQARSETWNQIKADVLNRPVLVPSVVEAAVLGAAILAALGIGAYASLEDAIASMVRVSRRLEPNPRNAELYGRLLEGYRELYPALRQTSWRLHDISTRSTCPSAPALAP
jgi:xylulokinase